MASLPEGTDELLERLDEQPTLVRRTAWKDAEPCGIPPFTDRHSQVPDELTQYIMRKNGQDSTDLRT